MPKLVWSSWVEVPKDKPTFAFGDTFSAQLTPNTVSLSPSLVTKVRLGDNSNLPSSFRNIRAPIRPPRDESVPLSSKYALFPYASVKSVVDSYLEKPMVPDIVKSKRGFTGKYLPRLKLRLVWVPTVSK